MQFSSRIRPFLLATLACALVAVGCGDDDKTSDPVDTTTDTTSTDATTTDASADASPSDASNDPEDTTVDATEEDGSSQDANQGDATADTIPDATPAECSQPCDCDQGEGCVDGTCTLGAEPVFCCDKDGCAEGKACTNGDGSLGLCGVATSPLYGVLIFNEVLIDGAVDGDPNGDGDFPDSVGDEFCEIVNTSAEAVSLDGFTLVENTLPTPRHTFASGTSLPAGHAMVVFGGGTAPDDTASAQFVTSNANEGAIPFGLHLDNDGDTLRLLDKDGALIASFSYGTGEQLNAVTDESMTRNPDITGDWTPHSSAAEEIFSPGTRADGSPF